MTTSFRPFPRARWLLLLSLAAGCGQCQSSPCPPPTEAQLCQWLWAGNSRMLGLVEDSVLTPATGPGCPAPSAAQAQLYGQGLALAAQIFALDAGSSDCNLPDSGDSQTAAQIAAWLADGHLEWSCEAAEACAQVSTNTAQADLAALDAGLCPQILSGTLSSGSSCTSNWECRTGLYCRSNGDSCGAGSCAVPVALGDACGDSDQCAGQASCENGLCVATPPTPLGALGAACADAGCQGCLLCVNDSCQAVAAGASCTTDDECPGPLLYCERGACRPSHTLGDDGGCVVSDLSSCLESWCAPGPDGGAGSCAPLSALGGPCLSTDDCDSAGVNCVVPNGQTLGTCAAGFAAGEPCPDDAVCAAGLFCDGTSVTCQPQKTAGASCGSNSDCQSGNCSQGSCGSPCTGNPDEGCTSLGSVSQILALGGAMALGKRRRRRG
jgi:hypothetical protein